MSDESLIVDKTGSIFLAGSYLVKAAVGEVIDNETLGGATTHTEISGVCDYNSPDDKSCLTTIREIIDKIGAHESAGFDRKKSVEPKLNPKEIYGIFPKERTTPYETRDIIKRLVDNSEFTEYKSGYGKTIVCGYARIDGWSVGIVANQRELIKTKKGEMQFGGVIYSDSADKAARFIMNCNQKKVPLVFLQDVTGAGNYAMCGKAYDPRLIVGWPTAQIAVMGGTQAAKVLLQIEVASLKSKGEEITPEREKEMFDTVKARYDEQTAPEYAASRLWIDAIIDPLDTRKWISMGIEAADHAPIEKPYNVGVIQT